MVIVVILVTVIMCNTVVRVVIAVLLVRVVY